MKNIWKYGLALLLSYSVFAALLFATADQVPARVATHFDGAGHPNGWMTHSGYLCFNYLFGLLFPLFIFGISLLVRVLPPFFINIPHRDYWLAPPRREATLDYFVGRMGWLACLLMAFIGGLHFLTLRANRSNPPQLEYVGLLLVVGPLLLFVAIFVIHLYRHFRLPS